MQIVLRIVNNRSAWRGAVFIVLFLCLPAGRHMAGAGEASGPVTPSELQALDRAISREINSSHLGSQILGDLVRLRTKLQALRDTPEPDPALPAGPGEAPEQVVRRLEAQAASGNRNALRSLSFYHMYLNDPEKALAAWRRMGKANDYDLAYLIVSSYLELALGEYNAGRRNLEAAVRFMDTRASLAVSNPLFCQTIAGYRLYEPRRQGDLLPGEDVLVYVELDGVDFVRTTDGMSECAIMFGLKLRDDASQAVRWAAPNFGEYTPLFAGPVRDLHAALTWRVPNDLEP
ncbi:MAG: hypothetical protein LIP23_10095, partial [Planctomycetes bacterium]|nr:hypothetical protein [Planctomycetota bacterium]